MECKHNKRYTFYYILFRPYLEKKETKSLDYSPLHTKYLNDTQTACSRFTQKYQTTHIYTAENNLYRLNKCYFSFILNRLRVAPSSVTLDKSLAQMLDIIGCIFLPV